MKRRFAIIACLVLALLAGCVKDPAPTQPSEPTPTVPAETEPVLGPINVVDGVVFDVPHSFQLLDERTAAVMRFEYPDGDYSNSVAYLDIVDLYGGAVTATACLEDADYFAGQPQLGGQLLVADYDDSVFQVLDRQLEVIRTIPVPETNGFFTEDLSEYYYLSGGILSVLDTAAGASAPVAAAADYRFSSLDAYDPRENTLLGTVKTTIYGYDSASIILDPDTGEISLLSDIYGIVQSTADGICAAIFEEETFSEFLRYTGGGSGTFLEIPSRVFGDHISLAPVLNSDYVMASAYDEVSTTACSIFRVGDTVTSYPLDMTQFPGGLYSLTLAPDGNLVGMRQYGDGYCLCILCPDQLPFQEAGEAVTTDIPLVDTSVLDGLAAEKVPPVAEDLADVRAMADALEETYGITILLSAQCELPAAHCDFPITTTDRVEWMDEAEYIRTALGELETALAMYPDGFFRQFRNEAAEYGVLVLLVEDINSENLAIGVQYMIADWYCIAVDISFTSAVDTFCHEIWHATENRIHYWNYALLDEETWHACNPAEAEYSYDDTLGYQEYTKWTYVDGGAGADSYFVDSYARVNEKEDRARLMEYIMARDDVADALMEAPALREKLRLMCDAIRQTFDTTGWENVRWERYFQ